MDCVCGHDQHMHHRGRGGAYPCRYFGCGCPNFHTAHDPIDAAYETIPEDLLDPEYKGPNRIEHGVWEVVMEFLRADNKDGRVSVLAELRLPARFYKLEVMADRGHDGKARPGFTISTGSGNEMGKLLVKIAKELQRGMIDFEVR